MRKTIGRVAATAVTTASAVTVFALPASAAPGGVATYRLSLNGAHEVPENPHGARDRGDGWLTIDSSTGQVCYTFGALHLTEGDALPFGAHIHSAEKGVAGGIVVHLFGTGGAPSAPTSYPTAETCVTTDPATAAAIVANPHAYYVNLHNSQHPSGVVRDQLRG